LKGLDYNPETPKGQIVLAQVTIDIVYDRLGRQRRNGIFDATGKRKTSATFDRGHWTSGASAAPNRNRFLGARIFKIEIGTGSVISWTACHHLTIEPPLLPFDESSMMEFQA
jgi:hypothetical protein